jgi:tRNA pseudouridine38-40 synthase
LPRYKIIIEYNGYNYYGWQKQPEQRTIQSIIEQALYSFSQQKINVHGACRTDAGVHAQAQVAHFDLEKQYDDYTILNALNFYLKQDNISILAIEKMADDFHSRFSAKKKTYFYKILNRQAPAAIEKHQIWHIPYALDVKKIQQAASFLIGTNDLTSFRAQGCQATSPIKTIENITIKRESDQIIISLTAQSFLYNQIRIIVGTLKDFGTGKLYHTEMQRIIAAKDRTQAGMTAPAYGLYLEFISYT